jgi:hypothetical protein
MTDVPPPKPPTPIRPRIARAQARKPMNETPPLTYVAEEPPPPPTTLPRPPREMS